MVHVIQLRVAGSVCVDISHVALMPRSCVGPGMRLIGWIEMRACRTEIRCTAIAEFMHVKAVLTGCQTSDVGVDLHAIGDRSKCDCPADFVARCGMKHCNRF